MSQATFHVVAPGGSRLTAREGQELLGRSVRYGKLGKVGVVAAAAVVDSGRAVRLSVQLTRNLATPDRRKFRLVGGLRR